MKYKAKQDELPWGDEPYRLAAVGGVDFDRVAKDKARVESERKESELRQGELKGGDR